MNRESDSGASKRAAELRERIDQLLHPKRENSVSSGRDESNPAEEKDLPSPREAIERRMRELDKNKRQSST